MPPKRRKTGADHPANAIEAHTALQDLSSRLLQLDASPDGAAPLLSAAEAAALRGDEGALRALVQAASKLQGAVELLQAALDAALALAEDSAAAVVVSAAKARDVVAYAHKLSYSTAPPPGFVPGKTPLGHFKPPAPQELQLRSSQLHQLHRERPRDPDCLLSGEKRGCEWVLTGGGVAIAGCRRLGVKPASGAARRRLRRQPARRAASVWRL